MKTNTAILAIITTVAILVGTGKTPIAATVPENLFNVGDSIGEGEAADDVIGSHHHDAVWATGYNKHDTVWSLNERFAQYCPTGFQQNHSSLDPSFNQAVSGADMYDFAGQAAKVITRARSTNAQKAGMITIFLGSNDACSDSLSTMTSAVDFEQYYRDGLDLLAGSAVTSSAIIHVSSIPSIYWLWESLHENEWCTVAWQFVPCANMLANPINDCESEQSRIAPDTIYPGDGSNCRRRKKIHSIIKNRYNPILKNVLEEYIHNGWLPNGYYSDIFSIRFQAHHINTGDCFHPSFAGQAFLAQAQWDASPWTRSNPVCAELPSPSPWLHLLLHN